MKTTQIDFRYCESTWEEGLIRVEIGRFNYLK